MTRHASSGTLTIAQGWVRLDGRTALLAPARDVVIAGTTPWLNTGLILSTPSGKQNLSLVADGVEVHLAQLIDHALAGPLRTLLAAHAAAHPDVFLPPPAVP